MTLSDAIQSLKMEKARLDRALAILEANLGEAPRRRGRRTFSPEARKKMAIAMRKRWAARKRAGKNSL